MELGAFSISLSVKDIAESQTFYQKLGFEPVMGDADANWLILRNRDVTIGLFQGLFERNTLTFNPGWDSNAEPIAVFTDIRDIQRQLKENGLELHMQADEATTGPASIMLFDPDGNPILLDQHVG